MRDVLRRCAMWAGLLALLLLGFLCWWWRRRMTRKPADVVRSIKAKVARVRAARAQPKAKAPPTLDSLLAAADVSHYQHHPSPPYAIEAPPVAPETAPHCPQGAPWCCLVCGNEATGDVCLVDGSKGSP